MTSFLDVHLMVGTLESLAAAASDLELLAEVADEPALAAEARTILHVVDETADALADVISRRTVA